MNDKNIKLKCEGCSFDGMILNEIAKEFKLLRSEYKDIFDKVKQINGEELKIKQTNRLISFFIRNMIDPNKAYTRDEICEMASDVSSRESSGATFMAVYNGYCTPENKIKITEIILFMDMDDFNQYVIRELDDVDILIKEFKLALRHEIGHIIDFISYDGMDADEYEHMNEININAEKEFFENLKTNPITNRKDHDTLWHRLPREAIADRNAGITIKDFHDIADARMVNEYCDYTMTFDIKISYEKINNKKKKNGDEEDINK